MGFFIGMMFLSIYISQHGDELNFIDVTLLSTLAYMVIGMIIVNWPFVNGKIKCTDFSQ